MKSWRPYASFPELDIVEITNEYLLLFFSSYYYKKSFLGFYKFCPQMPFLSSKIVKPFFDFGPSEVPPLGGRANCFSERKKWVKKIAPINLTFCYLIPSTGGYIYCPSASTPPREAEYLIYKDYLFGHPRNHYLSSKPDLLPKPQDAMCLS